MDQTALTIALVAAVILLSAFVQCSLGFGYAVIALSIFSYFLDFKAANGIVAVSVIPPLVNSVWTYRGELKTRTLFMCILAAAIGLPVGLTAFTLVEEAWLIRITGLLIFLLALEGLFANPAADTVGNPSWVWTSIAGAASGILAGAVGMGGPPVATYASRQSWSPRQIKVFLLAYSLLLSVLRVAGLTVTGWIDGTVLFYSLIATPFAMLGARVGMRASHNIDPVWFRRLTMSALLLLSAGMMLRPSSDACTSDRFQEAPPPFSSGE